MTRGLAPWLGGALHAASSFVRGASSQQPFHGFPQSSKTRCRIRSRDSCAEKFAKDLFLFEDSKFRFA